MIQSVKIKNLSLSKNNVRRTDKAANIDSLAASIAAHGLLQNLVVTPLKKANHYTVKAGGRRLRALQSLIAGGVLPADHQVEVLVLDDEDLSEEASLAENFHTERMNPADECTAFKHFLDKGSSAEDVAKRFGITTRFVEQRVRLAELAPVVFAALAAGEITLGVAQAYAVSSDVERQARVFETMSRSYYGDDPDHVRAAIRNGTVKGTDAKARFVGREAYLAAGGSIERDLFASEDEESWVDFEIVDDLAAAKLQSAAEAIAVERGLAFVTPVVATRVPYDTEQQFHEYRPVPRALTDEETTRVAALAVENDALIERREGEIDADSEEADAANARLDAIEEELEAIEAGRCEVDPEHKAQLGTFVYLDPDGTPRVHSRLYSEKPIARPRVEGDGEDGRTDDDQGEVDVTPKLSGTLVDELATQRRQILAAHVASDPQFALDLAIFLMANRLVYAHSYVRDHAVLKAAPAAFPIAGFRDEASAASRVIDEQKQALDTSWAGFPTLGERFDAFRSVAEEHRAAWLAFVVAQTLEATLNVGDGGRQNGFHDHLGRLLGIEVAQWWRPTAENFFGRVKKDMMLDALDAIGGPTLRGRWKDAKKSDLAAACASLCAGQGMVEVEVREKALAWLPDAMRFDGQETADSYRAHFDFLADEEDEVETGEGEDEAEAGEQADDGDSEDGELDEAA